MIPHPPNARLGHGEARPAKNGYLAHPQNLQNPILRMTRYTRFHQPDAEVLPGTHSSKTPGIDPECDLGPPSLDSCDGDQCFEVIKLDQQVEPSADVLALSEVRPSTLVNVAGSEAIRDIAIPDVF